MNRFEYREAQTVQEAIDMMHEAGGQIIAGSTDVLMRWRQGLCKPRYVLNIKRIPGLDEVDYETQRGLRLGALVSIRTLEQHPLIRTHYPALAQAAATFAGVQVRNLATLGGNVCNASPAGDTLPALLAYDATCRVVGPAGERLVPLAAFFRGPGQTVLQPAELLLELRLPAPLPRTGALYIKHSPRHTMDIAAVGIASVVALGEQDAICRDVRITLSAVAPMVVRAKSAEAMLQGRVINAAQIQQAAQAAVADASPIDDIRATAGHRRAVIAPLVQRTLHYAVQMAQGTPLSFQTQRGLAVEAVF
jgi:carbon-monoxide dehydrogenase medium subunit